ncbi:MAG: hypothetical protein ACK41D_01870 [Rubricoccaceae bacterium]
MNVLLVLLLLALVAGAVYVWARREGRLPGRPAPGPRALPEDDRASLGLGEVRPKQPAASPRDEAALAPAPSPATAPSSAPAPPPVGASSSARPAPPSRPVPRAGDAGPRRAGAFVRIGSPLWRDTEKTARAAGHLLESLAATTGGTAALLRYVGVDDNYAVEVLAGAATRAQPAPLPAPGNPLHRAPQDRVVSALDADAFGALAYHADPATTVGQALVRAVAPPPAPRLLLVLDVPAGAPPLGAHGLRLIGQHADLLADLLGYELAPDAGDPEAIVPPPADRGSAADAWLDAAAAEDESAALVPEDEDWTEDDLDAAVADAVAAGALAEAAAGRQDAPGARADAGAHDADAHDADAAPAPRSRLELIASHMADARRRGFPLALAIVTLQDAEAIYARGEQAVEAATTALLARLAAVEGTREAEVFGDLLVGALCEADERDAMHWAKDAHAAGDPIYVGLALLDDRHAAPEQLREDASAALQEAYRQGEFCVIAA